MIMEANTIRGNKALAAALGVHYNTVQTWKRTGVLAPAIVAEFRRVIIYDLKKVYECLNHKAVKPGRRAAV